MHPSIPILLLGLFLPSAAPAQEGPPEPLGSEPRAEHVVLISVDGLRPEFYLDPAWPAPFLQRMAREGARAREVRSVFPSQTYPAHTTMVTGVLPGRHGIHYNRPFEGATSSGRWQWYADSIRSPALWDRTDAAGLTSAGFSWPVSVGAPLTWSVPEIWPAGGYENRIDLLRRHASPPGFLAELEREATGRLVAYDSAGPTNRWDPPWWDERTADMAEYALMRYRPRLTLVHLVAVDNAQHDLGREHHRVREAVAMADRIVARLAAAVERVGIGPRTAFLVTGDHGHLSRSVSVAPNVWLAEAGMLEAGEGGEWRARFHVEGGGAFLHLRNRDDGEAVDRVREVLASLPAAERRLFRVLEPRELEAARADPAVPLALTALPGAYFDWRSTGPVLRPMGGAGHGYWPEVHPHIHTGLVAWGAGIRPWARVPRMGLEDVAPLVAELLGLELQTAEGVLWRGLLTER